MTRAQSYWFLRGFLLTFLAIGVILFPRFAQTQFGGNADEQPLLEENDSSLATDDPLGRRFIPLEESGGPDSNLDYLGAEVGSSDSPTSDDPQGRLRVPLADGEDAAIASNVSFAGEQAADSATVSSEEASAKEAALISAGAAYGSPLVIPAADFSADGFDPDSIFFSFGGGYWGGNAQAYGCLIAPAYLPAGATVTDMFVSVYDNDGSRDISVALRRVDNFAGTTASMASSSTSGTFAGLQTINDASIVNPLVVYPDYSYFLTTCLGSSSLRLYSARLYYTTP